MTIFRTKREQTKNKLSQGRVAFALFDKTRYCIFVINVNRDGATEALREKLFRARASASHVPEDVRSTSTLRETKENEQERPARQADGERSRPEEDRGEKGDTRPLARYRETHAWFRVSSRQTEPSGARSLRGPRWWESYGFLQVRRRKRAAERNEAGERERGGEMEESAWALVYVRARGYMRENELCRERLFTVPRKQTRTAAAAAALSSERDVRTIGRSRADVQRPRREK